MKKLMSYLILFSTLLTSGCSSLPSGSINTKAESAQAFATNYFSPPNYFSPNYKYFSKRSFITAKDVYSYYCQNKQVAREYRLQVQAIFPKPRPNTPVNIANAELNKARTEMKDILQSFLKTSFKLSRPVLKQSDGKIAIAVTGDSTNTIMNNLKDKRISDEDIETIDFLYMEDKSTLLVSLTPTLFNQYAIWATPNDGGSLSAFYITEAPGTNGRVPAILGFESIKIPQLDNKGIGRPRVLRVLNSAVIKAEPDSSLFGGSYYDRNSPIVHPISQVANLEPSVLFETYALLLPLADADRLGVDREYKLHDESGAINLNRAVELRGMIWEKMIDMYATIKEAPTKDSRVFKYEVSVDYSLACAYGRPVSDIVAE